MRVAARTMVVIMLVVIMVVMIMMMVVVVIVMVMRQLMFVQILVTQCLQALRNHPCADRHDT